MNNETWYLKHELEPAMAWADSQNGKDFINNHFHDWMTDLYRCGDNPIGVDYIIRRGTTPIYIGECLKLNRLFVHFWHMAIAPQEYFGLDSDEIDEVTVEVAAKGILNPVKRKQKELALREKYLPVLNPPALGDSCIPRAARYDAVHNLYNDNANLSAAIDLLLETPWAWGWNQALRKTPCYDYNSSELAYGLEARVGEYIDSLSRSKRNELFVKIATFMGSGFYVKRSVAVKILSRLLLEIKSREQLIQLASLSSRCTIKRCSDFLEKYSKRA